MNICLDIHIIKAAAAAIPAQAAQPVFDAQKRSEYNGILFMRLTPEEREQSIIRFFGKNLYLTGNEVLLPSTGQTLLDAAVLYSSPKIVRFMLSKGANPNTKDLFGKTALHYLADSADESEDATRSVAIKNILIQAGADKELEDNKGNKPKI